METTASEKKEAGIWNQRKGWRKWGIGFLKFLAYGGWLLVAVTVLASFFVIAALNK